jgi:hypothetical protein
MDKADAQTPLPTLRLQGGGQVAGPEMHMRPIISSYIILAPTQP